MLAEVLKEAGKKVNRYELGAILNYSLENMYDIEYFYVYINNTKNFLCTHSNVQIWIGSCLAISKYQLQQFTILYCIK